MLLMKVQMPQAHDVGLFASSSSFRFSSFSLSSSARYFASSAPRSSSLSVSDSTNYTYFLYIALSTYSTDATLQPSLSIMISSGTGAM